MHTLPQQKFCVCQCGCIIHTFYYVEVSVAWSILIDHILLFEYVCVLLHCCWVGESVQVELVEACLSQAGDFLAGGHCKVGIIHKAIMMTSLPKLSATRQLTTLVLRVCHRQEIKFIYCPFHCVLTVYACDIRSGDEEGYLQVRSAAFSEPALGRSFHIKNGPLARIALALTDLLTDGQTSQCRSGSLWKSEANQVSLYSAAIMWIFAPQHRSIKNLSFWCWQGKSSVHLLHWMSCLGKEGMQSCSRVMKHFWLATCTGRRATDGGCFASGWWSWNWVTPLSTLWLRLLVPTLAHPCLVPSST